MEQAQMYLNRFQKMTSLAEKEAIAAEYSRFLPTLSEPERVQARQVMAELWPDIRQGVAELDTLLAQANLLPAELATA